MNGNKAIIANRITELLNLEKISDDTKEFFVKLFLIISETAEVLSEKKVRAATQTRFILLVIAIDSLGKDKVLKEIIQNSRFLDNDIVVIRHDERIIKYLKNISRDFEKMAKDIHENKIDREFFNSFLSNINEGVSFGRTDRPKKRI